MLTVERDGAGLRVETPAKINIGLGIVGKRPDGFHELESLVLAISLTDTLEASAAPGGVVTLRVEPASLEVPDNEDNLVMRAARLLQREAAAQPAGVARGGPAELGARLVLHKRIPAGRGLGGGSSDAAAALVLLAALWDLRIAPGRLAELAAMIGSDVPFFLNGPLAVMRGRGEIIEPRPRAVEVAIVLLVPPFGLPTKDVYGCFLAPLTPFHSRVNVWEEMLGRGDLDELGRLLRNDLEKPALALRPELAQLRGALEKVGAPCVSMSGSGSAMYALAADLAAAERLVRELRVSEGTEVRLLTPWKSPHRSTR